MPEPFGDEDAEDGYDAADAPADRLDILERLVHDLEAARDAGLLHTELERFLVRVDGARAIANVLLDDDLAAGALVRLEGLYRRLSVIEP